MKTGFIGLGRMGRAIATRIKTAGHDLIVYNRTHDKTKELAAVGAAVATSIKEACGDSGIVVTMLSDDAALEQVAFGPGGICESSRKGTIHMVMGTHGTAAIRSAQERHAQAGQILVSAPVLGRPDVAAAGQLGVVLAGPREAAEKCRPLIDAVARRVFEAGDKPEHAAIVKLANGLVLGCAIEAMGEAFSLVRKYGVKTDVLYDVMTEGLFAAPAYKGYGKIIVDEGYTNVGFTAELGLKDIRLILGAAGAEHVPLPATHTVYNHLLSAIAHGYGGKDWSVIAHEQAQEAGLK
ncbi:MAG: NAD(P)-dependent oxidoreductase [Xanthobacteraceae bacterium]|nr:MAG: NAD(P)-dependent oxidoreductase [Xanthobacteraceae bacterium]